MTKKKTTKTKNPSAYVIARKLGACRAANDYRKFGTDYRSAFAHAKKNGDLDWFCGAISEGLVDRIDSLPSRYRNRLSTRIAAIARPCSFCNGPMDWARNHGAFTPSDVRVDTLLRALHALGIIKEVE